eukprot:CAMPEP_0201542376 /NCGR_PEP_ID=MMETSP0161_2-20130828/72000_1 /ASSEMBLY_ACC=CAM_ASM_000251 /TAXON_ID=180227 /ORGANISM="Neoparamoeba aestuarina, Strain SoJaBio B1-5/56/2" /LENGTH=478 /DNA_ID=CAMNT_0047950021 /DNA_START=91 /DNA_END=1527 /DNA_ORIENTATION=+
MSPHQHRSFFSSPSQNKKQNPSSSPFSPSPSFDLFVSCLPGLEPFLKQELVALGIHPKGGGREGKRGGGVEVSVGSLDKVMECHLCLGTASHVFLRCGEPFKARSFAELEHKTSLFPWASLLTPSVSSTSSPPPSLLVKASCSRSKLYHSGGVVERVERVIGNAMKGKEPKKKGEQATGKGQDQQRSARPINNTNTINTSPTINVRVHNDVVQLSLDTSLSPLHQRGWRKETAKAPLREDLAFALLLSSGWVPRHHLLSPPSSSSSLLDPFCGSGTILIEGAGIAAGLLPGRLRPPPLQGTRFYSPELWEKIKISWENKDLAYRLPGKGVLGSDRNEGAVRAAKRNAERAGVGGLVEFFVSGVGRSPLWLVGEEELQRDGEKEVDMVGSCSTLVVTNPPYGKRVSTKKDLLPLYQTLGERVKKAREKGRRMGLVVFGKDVGMVRRVGVGKMKALFTTQHGGLTVTALGSLLGNECLGS